MTGTTTTTAYLPTDGTTKTAVANLLLDHQGDWINASDFILTAGPAATRRIRQLRADGWAIRLRRNPESPLSFQYRLGRVPNKQVRSQYRMAVSA